jgi:hypothetical protein
MDGEKRVAELLEDLNSWEQMRQAARRDDPLWKDMGEIGGRIASLLDELAALGIRPRWNGREYVLGPAADVEPPPPSSSEEADS